MNEALYYSNGPVEWKYKQLGEVVKFEGGSQPPKKYFSNEKLSGMVRLIQIRDYKTNDFITYVPKELCRRFCNKDDIMIGRYGPPIFQILRGIEGAYNVALIKAIPQEDVIDKEYLYYFIKNEHLFKLIDGLSQRTSGQTGIDMEILKKYIIPIPTKEEQKKIASILSTVDEQIDNVEALIEKNKELKKGLMQTLLTKGIGHTKFKKTEIGEIPEEWQNESLGDMVNFEGGTQPPKKYFSNECLDGMIRLIQIRDYKSDKFKVYVPKELCRRFCDKSDVMIGRYGPPIFQILRGLEGAYNVALIKATPINERLDREYLYYFLNNEKLFNLIDSLSQRTSGQTGIDMEVLKAYKIPIPPKKEQEKIVLTLSQIDKRIENYENRNKKLEELKKGLMQQLLTGKIRTI